MEIVTLRFVVTEDDLNSLLVKFVTAPPKIRDLHFRVMSDALSLAESSPRGSGLLILSFCFSFAELTHGHWRAI